MNEPAKAGGDAPQIDEPKVRAELERQRELRRRNPIFAAGQMVQVGPEGTWLRVHSVGSSRIILEAPRGTTIRRGRLLTDEEFAALQKPAQEPA